MDNFFLGIGAAISERRKAKGITQEALKETTGLSIPTIAAAQRGSLTVSAGAYDSLLRVLGCKAMGTQWPPSPSELLQGGGMG